MTDLPPNPSIDIRALVLYDIHQWKTTEKSYKNYEKLCEVLGNEAISYEEYEYYFNECLKESYFSAKDGRSLLPDIRGCILSNVINGKSAKKSIDDLCDAFNYHKIDKKDHDFWFKRFGSGHFSQVTFSDFPEDVVAEIVEKCDIKSYLNFRSVSHGLRTVIDHLPPPCTDIKVYCGDTRISVTVDGVLMADWDYYKPANRYLPMEQFVKRIPGPLKLFLSNPKLRLKSFTFYTNSNYRATTYSFRKAVINHLNSLNHKIHVENFSIEVENTEDFIGILQCFKPRKLEKITLCDYFSLIDMNQIIKMDQWKQAKHLGLIVYGTVFPPIEYFLHFSTIEGYFGSISLTDIINFCDSVSKSTNFEYIQIENQEMWDTEEVKRVLNLQPTDSPDIYSIPNTKKSRKMTDIPPNSPTDIRALALYDIHQWKTTDKSYKNYEKMCELLGNEAISYEEYENWFNKYLEESYYSTRDKSSRGLLIPTMGNEAISYEEYENLFKKYLKEDERDRSIPDIRGCILSNVINKKSAEKSISDLCDAFNNHKIDKEDHDYWFKRFENGHLFNRVTFSDFPEDVVAEIVGRCDIKSYFNLRNVSYAIRNVIDQLRPPFTDIEMLCMRDRIQVNVDDALIADSEHIVILKLFLRNPKLKLKWFQFNTHSYFRVTEIPPRNHKQDFFDFLNSLDHKIHVEECMMWMDNEKDLIAVLKCMKSGTLEKLIIETGLNGRINEVVNMDQWKLAKHLKITAYELPKIENFFHFSTFELGIESITLENMVKLCDNASKSINFESFTLKTVNDIDTEEVKRVLNLQPTSSRYLYSIPNTNLIVQFNRWNSNWLRICKD